MSEIKFIYFDVGGVVIKDFSQTDNWENLKKTLGVSPSQTVEFDEYFSKCEEQMCKGVPCDSFLPQFAKKFSLNISPNFSLLNYFVTHFQANESIWPIIKKVKETFRIGLLTDMYQGMFNGIKEQNLLPPIKWDLIVDSSIEKMKKPYPEIFALATKRAEVEPTKILFIDNNQKNILGAKAAGWQTFFYDSKNYEKSSQELSQFLKLQ